MKLSLRLIAFLIAGITLVTFVVARNEVRSEKRGLRADLERRAEILAESLQEIVEPAVETGSRNQLRHIVERFGNREGLAGVVVYDTRGNVLAESSTLVSRFDPLPIPAALVKAPDDGLSEFVKLSGKDMHVYFLPLRSKGSTAGFIAVFHDASYIEAQSLRIWRETLWHVIAQVLLIVLITALIIRWTIIAPISRTAEWMKGLRAGRSASAPRDAQRRFPRAVFGGGSESCAKPCGGARSGGGRGTAARNGRIDVDPGAFAGEHSEQDAAKSAVCGVESRTLHARESRQGNRDDCPGKRTGDGAGANSARVRREVDRGRVRRRRPRNGGRTRPPSRSSRQAGVHAEAGLADERRRRGLLLWVFKRRPMAIVPHRAHATGFSRFRLAVLPGRKPQIRRRRAGRDGGG